MGVIITPKEQIDQYYASTDLSQSLGKALLKGLKQYNEAIARQENPPADEKPYFTIGKAVDTILTGEEGQFEQEYHVSELEKMPSDVEVNMIKMCFQNLLESGLEPSQMYPLSAYEAQMQECIITYDWYKGKPGDKRTLGLLENGNAYFQDLIKAHGKKVIDKNTKLIIDAVVMSLRTNDTTSKYFNRSLFHTPKIDIYYQLPIYFTYKGIACKALLDIVIVIKNDDGQIVTIKPFDIKTMTGEVITFPKSVKAYRYDMQGAWYTNAIYAWIDKMSSHLVAELYTVEPFSFIVESTDQPGQPLVFQLNDEMIARGETGVSPVYQKIDDYNIEIIPEIPGYEQFIAEYRWYEENGWDVDRRIAKAEGRKIIIGINGLE